MKSTRVPLTTHPYTTRAPRTSPTRVTQSDLKNMMAKVPKSTKKPKAQRTKNMERRRQRAMISGRRTNAMGRHHDIVRHQLNSM